MLNIFSSVWTPPQIWNWTMYATPVKPSENILFIYIKIGHKSQLGSMNEKSYLVLSFLLYGKYMSAADFLKIAGLMY